VGQQAAARSTDYALKAIGTFAILGAYGQGRMVAELVRYIGHHGDATGLEGFLITAMQSSWPHLSPAWASALVDVWHRFAAGSKYAERYPIVAYDERARRARVFEAGEISSLRPDTALPRKIAEAIEGAFVGGGAPNYRGPAASGAWSPREAGDTDHFFDGLRDAGFDWRSPGGWDGRQGSSWGGSIGRGPGSDAGGTGGDYRTGNPQPGDRPGGGGIPGVADLGRGRGMFDRGNPFNDQGALAGLYGPGKAFRDGGPFSEAFIGRPGPFGPEAFDGYDMKGDAKAKADTASKLSTLGNVVVGVGLTGMLAGVASGNIVTVAVAGGIYIFGAAVAGKAVKEGQEAERELAAAERQIDKEKREADQATKDKAEREKAEREKAEREKAEKERKEREQKEKDGKKPGPKKSETGIYPDPYGDGGGGVNWTGLSQIPVGDGEGGVGPLWLDALPTDDGKGVGPNRLFLPADDGGSGPPRPNSVIAFSSIVAAGPGLASFVATTGKSTAMVLGMPKIRSDGSIADAGLLSGAI
jgi:hypothetical protein